MNHPTRQQIQHRNSTTHHDSGRHRHGGHPTRAQRNRPRHKSTHTIPPIRRLPRPARPG
jgi:hypothetical protein